MLWKAWNSDVEVVDVMVLDMSNEIDPVDEATFNRLPDVFPDWWVPSESENIAAPMVFSSLKERVPVHERGKKSNEDALQELCQSFRAAYLYTSDACMSRDQSSLDKT